MAEDEFLRLSIANQVWLLVFSLAKTLVVPFLAAQLILSLRSARLRFLFRTGLILPMVVPGMVVTLLWSFVYDGSVGLLNEALSAAGLGYLARSWLGDPATALIAVAGIGFPWAGGLALLVYLAGLNAIPVDVRESAELDGASGLRRMRHIDLPLVRPQVRLLAILTVIGSLQDFGSLLVLTGGGPGLATHVPALHMYFQAFRFGHMGYASAIGLVIFLTIFAFSALNARGERRAEALLSR
jgi:raffinose/stachyose/melibiose transport system permease protein